MVCLRFIRNFLITSFPTGILVDNIQYLDLRHFYFLCMCRLGFWFSFLGRTLDLACEIVNYLHRFGRLDSMVQQNEFAELHVYTKFSHEPLFRHYMFPETFRMKTSP